MAYATYQCAVAYLIMAPWPCHLRYDSCASRTGQRRAASGKQAYYYCNEYLRSTPTVVQVGITAKCRSSPLYQLYFSLITEHSSSDQDRSMSRTEQHKAACPYGKSVFQINCYICAFPGFLGHAGLLFLLLVTFGHATPWQQLPTEHHK